MTDLASITGTLTNEVAHEGLLGCAVLMAIDAVFPIGGGIVMLIAGALAAGVFTGHDPTFFGVDLGTGFGAYLALSAAGTVGSLAGALAGWVIGRRGGRALIARWGGLLQLGPANMARAEGWFARHGTWAVFLGRLIPVARSFVSVPAGVLGSPLDSYLSLTLAGSAIWCFVVAAVGWALGASYNSANGALQAVGIGAVALVIVAAVAVILRQRAAGRRPA